MDDPGRWLVIAMLDHHFTDEETRICGWRYDRLRELGYSDEESALICLYDVDWHRLASLIGRRCDRWLAWQIVKPLEAA